MARRCEQCGAGSKQRRLVHAEATSDGGTGGLGLAYPASQGAADLEEGEATAADLENGEAAATNNATVVACLMVDRADVLQHGDDAATATRRIGDGGGGDDDGDSDGGGTSATFGGNGPYLEPRMDYFTDIEHKELRYRISKDNDSFKRQQRKGEAVATPVTPR
ncbi:hypothetical protein Scep_007141 [Stephania cephalantha]|uniref:Uncharacterized protein n=1 Tax=Stephania cephalantha TaxID=152367 RepID=A0AAP0KBB1_9MAGN